DFFTAEQRKNYGALRLRSRGEYARYLQYRRATGGVVVSSVVDTVTVHRFADSDVIKVGRKQHDCMLQCWIATFDHPYGVPGGCMCGRKLSFELDRRVFGQLRQLLYGCAA